MPTNPALLQGLADAIAGGALAGLSKEAGSDFFSPFIDAQQKRIARDTRTAERAEDRELRGAERSEDKSFATSERVMSQIFSAQQNALDRVDQQARQGYSLFTDKINAFSEAVLADPSAYPEEVIIARLEQERIAATRMAPAQQEAALGVIESTAKHIAAGRRNQVRTSVLQSINTGNFAALDRLDLDHPEDAAVVAAATGSDTLLGRLFNAAHEARKQGAQLSPELNTLLDAAETLPEAARAWGPGKIGGNLETLSKFSTTEIQQQAARATLQQQIPAMGENLGVQLAPFGASVPADGIVTVSNQDGTSRVELTPKAAEAITKDFAVKVNEATTEADLMALRQEMSSISIPGLDINSALGPVQALLNDRLKRMAETYDPGEPLAAVPEVSLDASLSRIASHARMLASVRERTAEEMRNLDLPISVKEAAQRNLPRQLAFAKESAAGTLITPTFLAALPSVGWQAHDVDSLTARLTQLNAERTQHVDVNEFSSSETKAAFDTRAAELQTAIARTAADNAARSVIGATIKPWARSGGKMNFPEALSGAIKASPYSGELVLRGQEAYRTSMDLAADDFVGSARATVQLLVANRETLASTVTAQTPNQTQVMASLSGLEGSFDAKMDDVLPLIEALESEYSPAEILAELGVPVNGKYIEFRVGTGNENSYKFAIKDMAPRDMAAAASLYYLAN